LYSRRARTLCTCLASTDIHQPYRRSLPGRWYALISGVESFVAHYVAGSTPLQPPVRPPWVLPALMAGISALALLAASAWTEWSHLFYLVPYTFAGNSLAPLPYDGALIYLGGRHSLWLIVPVAVAATVLIEAWNMELLSRLLGREGSRGFRDHRVTQLSLHWYGKAPFWSLVATCILPIIPHYPMRFLAVLAGYPLWKYQLSVVLGRGARYVALGGLGVALPIPGRWIVLASFVVLALGIREARRMNRGAPERGVGRPVVAAEEA
jgi:membrane protein YqaA with SNARE-associated domain